MRSMELARTARALRLAAWIGYGMATATLLPLLAAPWREAVIQHWARRILHVLRVRIDLVGDLAPGCLVVANHVSWLDILVFHALAPARLVAKADVRLWPVFGRLATRAGTLFVDRTRRADSGRVTSQMQMRLQQGERIVLFPEGTTTEGSTVLPFKPALFEAAVRSGRPVQPAALRYRLPSGERDPAPAFTGDATLLDSVWRILASDAVRVSVHCGTPFDARSCGRREAAAIAHTFVAGALRRADKCYKTRTTAGQLSNLHVL